MRRIGVLTSGGDAPGMNAAIRAVVRSSLHYGMSIVGIKRGYNGMMRTSPNPMDDIEEMDLRRVGDTIHRGGTFLKTARCKEFIKEDVMLQCISNMRDIGMEGVVVIGGDGSFRGAQDLCRLGFPAVGVPGTIDNDLPYTDYTIGYDTAVNTACDNINRIRETSTSHDRVSVIEVMGRACGDIALHSALACGAEMALVPEQPWNIEQVIQRVNYCALKGKRSAIIVVAEGAWASMEDFNLAKEMKDDTLPTTAKGIINSQLLSDAIGKRTNQEVRATVLGYLMRGGSPSAHDRIIACKMGNHAVELIREDQGGMAIGFSNGHVNAVPFAEALSEKRKLDAEDMNLLKVLSM